MKERHRMNKMSRALGAVPALLLLAACTTIPNGPSTYALPGTGKTFERFRYDDGDCRQYATSQAGGNPNDAAVSSGLASAAVGTAIGAVAGAAIGGHGGAAVGAGTGLIVGGIAGTGAAQASGYNLQQRYDMSYGQCMYAKGHKIPVSGSFAAATPRRQPAAAPAAAYPPPPPPPPPRGAAAYPPPPPPPPPPGYR
jgi:hypothetical protein